MGKCMPSRVSDAPSSPPEVRPSGVHGRGVYATGFIPEGTRIIEYTGQRVSWKDAPDNKHNSHTFNFGLENGEVINPEIGGNEARWLNHSCDPNSYMKILYGHILFLALRDIQPGEEITIDYESTLHPNSKKCTCGSLLCRTTINKL